MFESFQVVLVSIVMVKVPQDQIDFKSPLKRHQVMAVLVFQPDDLMSFAVHWIGLLNYELLAKALSA